MRTIIQSFPTIYGEAVNGSVLGQPNGSIARPPQNTPATITLSGTVKVIYTGVLTPATNLSYVVSGLVVDSEFTAPHLEVVATNAADATVCISNWNLPGAYPPQYISSGPSANKPTDGDALTVTVNFVDDNGVTFATGTIAATAEVPA